MNNGKNETVIGNVLLKQLEPKARPFEVRDSKLTGFLVRVQPSGVMTYVVQWGPGKRMSLGRVGILTPAQARDRAREVLADVVRGLDPMAKRREARAHTLKSFLTERYGPWVETNRKSGAATCSRLRACFLRELGDKNLADVTPWLAEKWRSSRLKAGIKPATVNRDLTSLKAALQKAVEWNLIEQNPLAKLKPTKVDTRPNVRYLSDDEETRLRAALDARETEMQAERDNANKWRASRGYELLPSVRDHLKPLVLLAINTGLRRGELFNLTWEDVHLGRAMLTVRGEGAKAGQTRHVPLNAEAKAVLAAWKKEAPDVALVFPGRDGGRLDNVKRSWASALDAAKIKNFRFHDLRHHFASRLVMAGVDLNTVRELLGHADIKMTLRYAHLAPEHTAAAVAKLVRSEG